MKYILDDIVLELGQSEVALRKTLAKRLRVAETSFRYEIRGQELFLRGGKRYINYRVTIETLEFIRDTSVRFMPNVNQYSLPKNTLKDRPVIVGAGLSGLFCAYALALAGVKPIVLEKGKALSQRLNDVISFERAGKASAYTAYTSGQGGILGLTGFRMDRYSDALGKRWAIDVIENMAQVHSKNRFCFLSSSQAQALTDGLIREITSRGGEVIFGAEFTGAKTFLGRIKEAKYKQGAFEKSIPTGHIVLATGENNIPLYNALAKKNEPINISTISFFLEKDLSEYYKATSGSSRESSRIPSLFFVKPEKSKADMETMISFFYPHAAPMLLSKAAHQVNLGLQLDLEKSGNGLTVISLRPNGALTSASAQLLTKSAFKKAIPYHCPGEPIKDFLSSKNPLRLGQVKGAYPLGTYLEDFHSILPRNIADALKEQIENLSRDYPVFTDGRALLIGPSICYENGRRLLKNDGGKPAIKGLFLAAPKRSWDYDGVEAALGGLDAATSVLENK